MLPYFRLSALILTLLLAFPALPGFAAALQRLEKPPLGEHWFGIFFNDERTGFAYSNLRETGNGYEIHGESSVKMGGLVFSREATIRENYTVNKDMTLRYFTVSQKINGTPVKLTGEVTSTRVKVVVESRGAKKEKILKCKSAVYPPIALNLYPLLRGVGTGKSYRLPMLDPEEIKIKDVRISVVGFETIDGKQAIHMRNNLYPVDNDIWIDFSGSTLKESVRDGWIVTRAEDEKSARRFISQAALAKIDLILDYSLIKIDTRVSDPSKLRKLVVQLSDFPATIKLMASDVQKAERLDGGNVLFTMDNSRLRARPEPFLPDQAQPNKYLEPTKQILSNCPDIILRKNEIADGEQDFKKVVEKLTRWVASNIKETNSDNRSALETLKDHSGNCQSHVRLYASFARAAGIPTKIVSGLVYLPDKGFLYHSWAESDIGYWLPVDPTFGEIPADLTHIKLVEGDSPDDILPLAVIVGKIGAKVLDQKY
jgi:transglutaminase-like putative cysteine protease